MLVAAVAVVSYSLAAYTSLSSAKRVITVRGSEQYFTSDILVPYETTDASLQSRVKSFGKNDRNREFTVTVSNHLQSDSTMYDKKNIEYTFTVNLVDANGNQVTDSNILGNLKVDNESLTEGTYTKKDSLSGGTAQDKKYTFSLTDDEILQYRIKITAVPTNRKEYKLLGRLILLTTDSTVTRWTGSFLQTEKKANQDDKTLGLLNYRISGHLEEDCVLSWDSSKVEIDKWFLDQMGITDEKISKTNQIKSVNLHLGAAGTPQQYTIQFYRTYAVNDLPEKESWDTISTYVKFTNSNLNTNSEGD